MKEDEALKLQYFKKEAAMQMSALRRRVLKTTEIQLFLQNPIKDALDKYLKTNGRVPAELPAALAKALPRPVRIDLDRESLIKYFVTAKGLHNDEPEVVQGANRILAAMSKANEPGKIISFKTDSPFFIRFTSAEVITFLLEAMIAEKIPIENYFDGSQLINRSLFTEMDWDDYHDFIPNRGAISELKKDRLV